MPGESENSILHNYGEAEYWDNRYQQESTGGSFDWYQRYSALRPFFRNFFPSLSSPLLVLGCGNAVMSEDMVNDEYGDIMNIDISQVVIEMMEKKCTDRPQLKYKKMDARRMNEFSEGSFDGVIDKGTLDSLMCGKDAPDCAAEMLGEVSRVLKPGGTYMLITYGEPKVRMPHLNRPLYNWNIDLYIIPRPGFQRPAGSSRSDSLLKPVPVTEKGLLPAGFVLEDPDSHFIYKCKKNG